MRAYLPQPVDAAAPARDQSPERQLWCAVIGRALEDALGNPGGIGGESARLRAIEDARDWFVQNGEDFRRACDAAGCNPHLLRHRALQLIADADPGALAAPALTRKGEAR